MTIVIDFLIIKLMWFRKYLQQSQPKPQQQEEEQKEQLRRNGL